MTDRVILGDRGGVMGLFATLPGYDVNAGSPDDKTKFAFSTTWNDSLLILLSGTAAVGTWVSLPPEIQFYPFFFWDQVVGTNVYKTDDTGLYYNNSGTFTQAGSRFLPQWQTVGGVVQITVGSRFGDSGTFRYIVTNLRAGSP